MSYLQRLKFVAWGGYNIGGLGFFFGGGVLFVPRLQSHHFDLNHWQHDYRAWSILLECLLRVANLETSFFLYELQAGARGGDSIMYPEV